MVPLAVSTVVQIAYVVALVVVLFVGPSTVAWWARHFYGPKKMARAEERYGEDEFA